MPQAFAAYVLEQYASREDISVQESPSINVVLDEYFARAEWRDALDDARSPIRKPLQTNLDRCKRKAEVLQQEWCSQKRRLGIASMVISCWLISMMWDRVRRALP